MSDLPIDPKSNNSSRGAWLSSSDCHPGHDCARCRTDHNRQTDGLTQTGGAVVATISVGSHAGEIAISPDGRQVYVIAAGSVKVISRLHHIVGTYRIGPHPKSILVSDDGTRVYVTGYDGSTSVISTADHTVNTFALERSIAEVVSPDGAHVYLAHSGVVGDTAGSWISVVNAAGATVAVVPVDRHVTDICLSPDGQRLYVASRRSNPCSDWDGLISTIDTRTYRVVDKLAVEFAPDTITMSLSATQLYATHYHKNAFSIIDLRISAVSRWVYGDAPIDIAVSPDAAFACVTNLHSLTFFNAARNIVKRAVTGGLRRQTRLSTDGKRAYTVDFVRKAILAFDTADNAIIGTTGVNGHPQAMALGPDGEFLYFSDYRDGVVTVISTALLLAWTAHRS
jgi:DNA-binding beta-propeller fold protein YncE